MNSKITKFFVIVLLCLLPTKLLFAQAAASCSALATSPNAQICTSASDNVITGTTPNGGTTGTNWGCLSTRPRQSWYYFQVQTSGTLNVNITNTPSTDYDAAIWGPINTIGDACLATQSPPKACDYAITTFTTLNAVNLNGGVTAGQIYVLVVTNYSNVAGGISISTSGTATINGAPTPPTSVTTSQNNYCYTNVPSTTTLSATGGNAGTGSSTNIQWYRNSCGDTLIGTTAFGASLTIPAPSVTTTYYARYTNSCGPTVCVPVTITVRKPIFTSPTSTNVSCNGGNDGTITAPSTGGTAPYTYTILPGGTSNSTGSFSGLQANTYTITSTDAAGCTGTTSLTITQPTALSSTITSTNLVCNGDNTGTASVTASGGTTPYSYSWSPSGGTASSATGLAANTYTCTITDSKGCVVTKTATITQPSALSSTITSSNVLCNGGSTGTSTVSPSGGTTPYTYAWTPSGGTSATATGLAIGTYTCTIKDVNNCSITQTVTITQPTALTATIASPSNVTCNGLNNGSATLTVSGGTTAYTYAWSPSGGTNSSATGLAPNTYTATVTDANGCTRSSTVTITQPTAITESLTSTAIACATSNSTITTTASGGTGTLTYSIDGGTSYQAGTTFLKPAGTYTVTVKDANNCTKTSSITITSLDLINPTITCPTNKTQNSTIGSCSSIVNSIDLTATDNCTVSSISYTITGATTASSPLTGINSASGTTFNVGISTITYLATDNSGNTSTCSFTVTINDTQNPVITCPANVTQNATLGICNSIVNAINAPATDNCSISKVTFTITGSTTASSANTGINNASGTAFNVGTSTVTYTATDINGNTATCSFTVTINDNQNPTITCPATVTVNSNTALCYATNVSLGTPTTSDNCGVSSSVAKIGTTLITSTTQFPVGNTTVTWTVTDVNGNTATCNQTVTVSDNQNPTITCPANITVNANAGSCFATNVTLGTPTTSDNCSISSTVATVAGVTVTNATQFPVGNTNVIWTVTDVNGNTSTCNQTVTVSDIQNPTITCPANVTVNANTSSCFATNVTLGTPTTSDNCGISSTVAKVAGVTVTNATQFPVGNTTVTWTVTDVNGNTATCNQTVTVSDNQNPTITCPANVIVNANTGSCFATNVTLGTPTTSDNCGISSTVAKVASVTVTNATQFPLGNTTVVWTVTDVNGNTATCNQIVTVNDIQNPVITCPANVIQNAATGVCNAVVNAINATATDNCSVQKITYTITGTTTASSPTTGINNASGTTFNVGVSTVTYVVTDVNGNTATCSFTVTLNDTQNPTITCPPAVSVNANTGSCFATNVTLGTPTISDNCGISSTVATIAGVTVTNATQFPVGSTTVVWTVTDVNGNTGTCNQSVTVNDTQNPTITCPANKVVSSNSACQSVVNNLAPTNITDNCGVASTTFSITGSTTASGSSDASGTTFNLGVSTVSYTVTDIHGNTANCSFTVTVNDSTKPSISCPPTQTINLAASGCTATLPDYTTSASKSDNCSSGASIIVTQNPAAGTTLTGTGTISVKLIATDASGNKDSCTFNVIKVNTNPPLINCVSALNLSLTVNCTATLPDYRSLISTSDVCNGTTGMTIVQTPAPGTTVSGTGTMQIKFVATDLSNNQDSCFTTLTKIDVTDPTITCPASQNVTLGASCSASLPNYTSLATVSDACTPTANIVVTQSPIAGTTISGSGATTVTLTATDSSGNSASCSFTVNKIDNTLPTITCPATVTINADAGDCFATNVNLGTPTTTDNCGVASSIATVSGIAVTSSAQFPVGNTTVVWTVTDVNGNTATCNQTVTVSDNQNPVITCPANVTQNATTGVCNAVVNTINATATDNCAIQKITYTITGATTASSPTTGINNASGTTFNVGVSTVTYIVTDVNGNMATCNFTVTIIDTQNPTITCPATVSVNANTGSCFATNVNLGTPTTADNCSVSTTIATVSGTAVTNATQFPVGNTTVVWTTTDVNGNTATCNQTVTVNDTQNPTITCPAQVTINADAGDCFATNVNLGTPTTADNCGISTTIPKVAGVTVTSLTQFPVGNTTVTWTVTDVNGNTGTCNQTVTVSDIQKPTISCPMSVTVNANTGSCFATNVNLGTPTTTDNCAVNSTIATLNGTAVTNATQFPVGTNIVKWTVTDNHGNVDSCNQTVIVNDIQNPTITCPASIIVNANTGSCFASNVNLGTPATADNCGVASTFATISGTTVTSTTQFPVGNTTVNWTVTDVHGNTATCNQTVTVNDTQNPTITCPSTVTINADAGDCFATNVNLGTPTTADNCGVSTTIATVNGIPVTSATQFTVGNTTVVWTVTDVNGNTAICNQTVTVSDNQSPTIVCPIDITANANQGSCFATNVALGTPTTADNCAVSTTTKTISGIIVTSATQFPVGNTTVTWTVTDVNGNSSTCTQIVTIEDNQNPTITCPANVIVNANTGSCFATNVALGTPTTADNCGISTSVATVNGTTVTSATQFAVGTTNVIWTTTDVNGNTANCTQIVTINDNQNPVITCPANVTINSNSGACYADNVALGTATTTDNCGISTITKTLNGTTVTSATQFPVGVSAVTYTVTDIHGNSSTCTQTVTVNDNQNPTITCPADVTINANSNLCYATNVNLGTPTTADNCGILSAVPTLNTIPVNSSTQFAVGSNSVLWTVTDVNGNTSTCAQDVIVNDNELPTITCPANVTVTNDAGQCYATNVNFGTPVTSDNCGILSVVPTINSVPVGSATQFLVGSSTITWTITDIHGNSTTCSQTIIVNDTELPTISCPANVTQNTDFGACSAVVNSINAITNDNCGISKVVYTISGSTNVSSPTIGINNASGITFNKGTSTVNYSITDIHGNTNSCNFTVTINDIQNPTLTCPTNVVLSASSTCDALVTNLTPLNVLDNCGVVAIDYSITGATTGVGVNDASNTTFNLGQSIVTYSIQDASGNITTCSLNVNVNDNTNPVINCPPTQTLNLNVGCGATLPDYTNVTVTDNCSNANAITVTQVPVAGTTLTGTGTVQVTLTATDENNNAASCSFDVIKVNINAPVINCISAQNIYLENNCTVVLPDYTSQITSSDVCAGTTGVTIVQSPAPGTVLNGVGAITVTFTSTDLSNNVSTCTTTINKLDTIAPVLVCPSIQELFLDGTCSKALPDYTSLATVTDNCNTTNQITITQIPAPNTIVSNAGAMDVDLYATDIYGNSTTCNFKVVKTDTVKPMITCPTDVIVNADANLCTASGITLGIPSTTDNCGIDTLYNNALTIYPVGNTTITWTTIDINGNTSTCTQNVIVNDNQKPSLTCPGNILQKTDAGLCNAVVDSIASVISDNCGIQNVTYTIIGATQIASPTTGINDASNTLFNVGISQVKYIVTDIHNNIDSCEFSVEITDLELPAISCPGNVTAYSNNTCDALVLNVAPTSSDNCGVLSTVYSSTGATILSGTNDISGTNFATGITNVTYTVTDIHGNTNSCSFVVTVLDTIKPILNCPPTQQLNLDGTCTLVMPDYIPSAFISDNCSANSNLIITQTPAAGTAITGTGLEPITLSVTDESGNNTTCTLNIIKVNSTPPIINCIGAQNLALAVNCTANLPDYTTLLNYSDICVGTAGVTVTQIPAPNTLVSGVGTETVTFTAIDASNNTSSCSIILTKIDTTAPSITCPIIPTNYVNNNCEFVVPNYVATATDACSLPSQITYTQSPSAGTILNGEGNFNVVFIATDSSGNQAICNSVLSISDTIKPTINGCPTTTNSNIVLCEENGSAIATWTIPSATDNCSAVSVNATHTSGSTFNVGTTPVTYSFTDANGNVSTCTFNVVVKEKPTLLVTNPPCTNPVDVTSSIVTAGSTAGSTFTYFTDTTYTTTLSNPTNVGVAGTYGIVATKDGCESKAPVTVTICGFPFPIELLYFNGNKTNTTNYLYWATAKELSSSHFNLQKTTNNSLPFQTIGTVNTKAVNGNSEIELQYNFDDLNPVLGNNFYKLEHVDIDGKKSYSDIINLVWQDNGEAYMIYPNPTENIMYFELLNTQAENIKLKIISMSGQVVKVVESAINDKLRTKLAIDINEIATGVYSIQVILDDSIKSVEKIEKK